MIKICAIDFSLRSCAISWRDLQNKINCHIFQRLNKSTKVYENSQIRIHVQSIVKSDTSNEEYNLQELPFYIIDLIGSKNFDKVLIESYGYSGSGIITAIAESLGIVKNFLMIKNIPFENKTPQEIKKFFTGKGNASKCDMINEFEKRFDGIELTEHKKSLDDVADAVALLLLSER